MIEQAPLLGQILAVLSATAFAFANVCISRTRTSGGDKGVMFSVLVTVGLSATLWLAIEVPRYGTPSLEGEAHALGMFVLAGLLAMVFGRTLVFESIRRLGVSRSTSVKRLNPFFSVILATILLAEPFTRLDGLGMVAIALAFVLLIRDSVRSRGAVLADVPPPRDYLFGVFAALAYGSAYVARKVGLNEMGAPTFGTFVSAASGFAAYAVLAVIWPRYRANFKGMFRHLDKWIVIGAVMVSLGQILMFSALAYEDVSTVVMIASLEIFIAIFLSVVVFRSERLPGVAILLAAALAMAGVVLVAAG
ncbi:EamA family transporter [Puniceibacterium sp. IMCC21224]|uniref:EamA family transporter n=1 Tax=Puniceibacterium sp. IMCC21224 TaxID=1618204 RepID=UPI0018CD60A5|nr:EamA family transporter [Puniceibacterium sp. IMCC21224]